VGEKPPGAPDVDVEVKCWSPAGAGTSDAMMRTSLIAAAVALLLWPTTSYSQNREHLQMTADLRILQEHVSRLQLAVNRLDEQATETTRRIDAVNAAGVKGFADQQLLINQLASTLTSVRERLDDNSVRVSQLGQEFTAVREGLRLLTDQINRLVGLLQPPIDPTAAGTSTPAGPAAPPASSQPASPAAAAAAPSTATPPLAPVIMPSSAGRIFSVAQGDYYSARYDNAIEGFREVIQSYPTAPDAAIAQFQIGESYYYKKDCKSAVVEYQKFVTDYPKSDRRPEGLYMLGVCYSDLGQRTNAQRSFEQVVKEHPSSNSAIMATQRLQGMGR